VFSYFAVYAVTYTDNIEFIDNCYNKIELRVIRTLSNVSGECGLVKCEVNVIELNNSGQYIDKYDNMEWDNGNSIAQVYDFNTPVYFFYQYNGIYGIDFSMDIVTYCGTFSYEFNDNVITVLGCDEDNCSSSFSYCEFYLEENPPGWLGQIPKLYSVSYLDPNNGPQTLDGSNNYGIFNFPYYGNIANTCDLHPNLFDFVNDMNKFLIQSGIGGVCEFYYTDLPNYCKRYVRYLNTGVSFSEMNCEVHKFVSCIVLPPQYLNPVYPSPDFPVSTACLTGSFVNGENNTGEILENIQISGMSSIINEKIKTGIYCYPNIAKCDLFINNLLVGKYKAKIYSLSGQIIKQFEIDNKLLKVSIADFEPGMYFIRYYNEENGHIETEKIIVQ